MGIGCAPRGYEMLRPSGLSSCNHRWIEARYCKVSYAAAHGKRFCTGVLVTPTRSSRKPIPPGPLLIKASSYITSVSHARRHRSQARTLVPPPLDRHNAPLPVLIPLPGVFVYLQTMFSDGLSQNTGFWHVYKQLLDVDLNYLRVWSQSLFV